MRKWTLAEIRAKIESENDLQDEDFVRPSEMLEYINEAIEEAGTEILTLYQDYFLDYVDVPVTPNMTEVDLPESVYAMKIRRCMFTQGDITRPVKRLRDWHKFEEQALAATAPSSNCHYSYFLINRAGSVPKMLLIPRSADTWTLRIWYIREPKRLALDTDVCDIPFVNFIFAHVKVKVQEKEGSPSLASSQGKLEQKREQMVTTLSEMVPDADNGVEADTSHYEDMN